MNFKKIIALLLGAMILATSFSSCTRQPQSEDFNYSAGLTEDGYFANLTASDYLTLPNFREAIISPDVLIASQAEIQDQIDRILSENASYHELTDRAVVDGDTLNIDYVGKVDGVEFSGGNTNGEGTDVTIGVTQYIDDFLEQLIGHMPGETFDIEVTFPDPYSGNADLSGKDAVFTVTINYIQGDAVNTELTDEIASQYGFDTKEELIADIEQWIINQQKLQFFDELISEVECDEIPAAVLDFVKNLDIAYFANYAALNDMDLDTFMRTYVGYDSLDAYLTEQAATYKENATKYLIIQAIAETEGLTASDEDIAAAGYDGYITTHGKPYLKLLLLQGEIVPNFVADNAVVSS